MFELGESRPLCQGHLSSNSGAPLFARFCNLGSRGWFFAAAVQHASEFGNLRVNVVLLGLETEVEEEKAEQSQLIRDLRFKQRPNVLLGSIETEISNKNILHVFSFDLKAEQFGWAETRAA